MNSITPEKSSLRHPLKSKPGSKNPNWKGGKVRLICEHCKEEFEVIPSRANKARYCSLSCCNKSDERRALVACLNHAPERKNLLRGQRKERVKTNCAQCGAEMYLLPSHFGRKLFCQPSCQFAWRRKRMSGEGNPSWAGGVDRSGYPWNWRQISKKILERDGYQCWNIACESNDERMVVHHIDYDKKNCSDENLITVCGVCNSRVNYRRHWWSKFLAAYNRARLQDPVLFSDRGMMIVHEEKIPHDRKK